LRHALHRAVHGPAAAERRRLSSGITTHLRQVSPRRSARRAWLGRQQRAFPEHGDSRQRAGGRRQAIPDDGISESHALYLRGTRDDAASLYFANDISRATSPAMNPEALAKRWE